MSYLEDWSSWQRQRTGAESEESNTDSWALIFPGVIFSYNYWQGPLSSFYSNIFLFFVLFLLKSHPSSVILRFWRQKPRSSANLFYLYFPLADNSLRQKGMRNAIPRILEKDKEENVVRQEENKLPKLYLKMLLSHTSQVMVRKDYI